MEEVEFLPHRQELSLNVNSYLMHVSRYTMDQVEKRTVYLHRLVALISFFELVAKVAAAASSLP